MPVGYLVAEALQSPFFLRRDDNDRVEIACNYQVMKKPSATLLLELVTYLAAQGLGTVGTDLFYGRIPASPDVCTIVKEYGGLGVEPDLGTPNIRLEFPRVQVVNRGVRDDYDTPRASAQAVLVAFTKLVNTSL